MIIKMTIRDALCDEVDSILLFLELGDGFQLKISGNALLLKVAVFNLAATIVYLKRNNGNFWRLVGC